jgi:hypothetical protein
VLTAGAGGGGAGAATPLGVDGAVGEPLVPAAGWVAVAPGVVPVP